MSDTTSIFDSLWVIESLRHNDLKTGRSLFESQLLRAKHQHPELAVHFKQPESASDLIALLGEISEKASQGSHPMLHLECHGGPEGLQTTNGDIVDWETIRLPLISINEHSKLNLVIVVAACNGAHLIQTVAHLDRAPFWAVIGPTEEITAGQAQRDFGSFYEKYFDTLSGDLAIAEINKGATGADRIYKFISVEGLFKRAYTEYYTQHCLGKGKQKRIEDLLSLAMSHPAISAQGLGHVRRTVKNLLAENEIHFESIKHRFFFLDTFPENAGRFATTFQDIAGQ